MNTHYTIQLVSLDPLDLEYTKPLQNVTDTEFKEGVWHDPYECTSWYDAATEKECARVAIEHAEKAILELKQHIKQLKKVK